MEGGCSKVGHRVRLCVLGWLMKAVEHMKHGTFGTVTVALVVAYLLCLALTCRHSMPSC
jgi:hypothetical protein